MSGYSEKIQLDKHEAGVLETSGYGGECHGTYTFKVLNEKVVYPTINLTQDSTCYVRIKYYSTLAKTI